MSHSETEQEAQDQMPLDESALDMNREPSGIALRLRRVLPLTKFSVWLDCRREMPVNTCYCTLFVAGFNVIAAPQWLLHKTHGTWLMDMDCGGSVHDALRFAAQGLVISLRRMMERPYIATYSQRWCMPLFIDISNEELTTPFDPALYGAKGVLCSSVQAQSGFLSGVTHIAAVPRSVEAFSGQEAEMLVEHFTGQGVSITAAALRGDA